MCVSFSPIAVSRGYSLVPRLLVAVASVVAEHRLYGTQASVAAAVGLDCCGFQAVYHRLSSCSAWVSLFRSMWNLPGSGIKPMSLAS